MTPRPAARALLILALAAALLGFSGLAATPRAARAIAALGDWLR